MQMFYVYFDVLSVVSYFWISEKSGVPIVCSVEFGVGDL